MEIRTDPKNTAYVVTEGAKKRDTGEDKQMEGDIKIMTEEERDRLRNDAFAALEVKIEDRKQLVTDKSRIEEIHQSKEKDWDDPYAASKKLRRAFREDRKARQKIEASTESLKDRMSLGMDLLAETEGDRRRASLVDFGDFDGETAIVKAKSKPLFADTSTPARPSTTAMGKTKATPASEARLTRDKLRHELENNTRAVLDPFLSVDRAVIAPSASIVPTLRRKADSKEAPRTLAFTPLVEKGSVSTALVDYDSD